MPRRSGSNTQMKAARKVMKRRRKALAALADATPDQKFETTMKVAEKTFDRFKNAYKELAKR